MAQVALAWLLTKPVVTAPIVGATKPHYLLTPPRLTFT
jgi:aryl-alcohol dehydrogenase-like predicted oxidoreductase